MKFVIIPKQLYFGFMFLCGVEPFEVLLLFVKLNMVFELDAFMGVVGSYILLNGLTQFEVVVG